MKKRYITAVSVILGSSLLWSGGDAATVEGTPDQPFDRLKWLFEQFGSMPKGMAVTLLAIALIVMVCVVYYLLFVKEEERNAKRQFRTKSKKNR